METIATIAVVARRSVSYIVWTQQFYGCENRLIMFGSDAKEKVGATAELRCKRDTTGNR